MPDTTDKARIALFKALHAFQGECPSISKNSTAGQKFRYSYASLDHIWDAIKGKLSEHGLSVSWDACSDLCGEMPGIQCTCIVRHVDGGEVAGRAWVPIDRNASMNDSQKGGASITYAQRYSLGAALGLASITEDTDAQSETGAGQARKAPAPRPAAPAQKAAPAPAAPSGDGGTIRSKIKVVSRKTGTNDKGPWTRYGIIPESADGMWLNTFSDSFGSVAEDAKTQGIECDMTYETEEYKGRPQFNLTAIAPVLGDDPPF